MTWSVRIFSLDYPFDARLAVQADTASAAQAKAIVIVQQPRVAQQLGPMSWHFCGLTVGDVERVV